MGRLDLRTKDGEEIRVTDVIIHRDFDPRSLHADIALQRLAREPGSRELIALAATRDPGPGEPVTLVGWGRTGERDPPALELLEATMPVVDQGRCASLYQRLGRHIFPEMLCASEPGRKDACYRDSGGPLFLKGRDGRAASQIGVTSAGFRCADPEFPGIYTRVSSYVKWIREQEASSP